MEKFWITLALVVISIIGIILLTSKARLNSFVSLLIASLFLAFLTMSPGKIVSTLQEGFGKTMAYIGFLVIFGAIIGIALDKSGGIISITNFIFKKVGKDRSVLALILTGFVAGIPIFCDTAFIILSSLVKSLSARTKISLPFIATILATTLFSVHCLVPTHPGVLAGAQLMHTNIGSLMLTGIVFAIPGAVAAYFWSRYRNSKFDYPAHPTDDFSKIPVKDLPSPLAAFLPVFVPIILILTAAVLGLSDLSDDIFPVFMFKLIGDPVLALLIGAVLSVFLLKRIRIASLNKIFDGAVVKAGPILIITAAGGMFGTIITATGVGKDLGEILSTSHLGLWVPFLIAAFLKTAQGSSTVAVITAASFVAPMLPALGLDAESGNLFSMLAMGAGSMIFSHANDSYFWVVTEFSEIKVESTFRVFSSSTFVMGMTVFLCVWMVSFFVL